MIQCPSCGGGLRFEIETQKMVCDLCGSHFDPQSINTESGDSTEVGVNAYDVAVHICPSCGAMCWQATPLRKTPTLCSSALCGGTSPPWARRCSSSGSS